MHRWLHAALLGIVTCSIAHAEPPPNYLVSFGSYTFQPTTQNIMVVDPENPNTAVLQMTDTALVPPLIAVPSDSTFVPPTTLADLHNRWIISHSGGKLFLTNLLKPGPPNPVQVSSESNADKRCAGTSVPGLTLFVYELPGADGDCAARADNEYRMVTFDMGPADAPLAAKRVVAAVHDAQRALIGWLAIDGNELKRYDSHFNNGQPIETFAAGVTPLGVNAGLATHLLRVDNSLRAYHVATGTLSGSLYDFVSPFGVVADRFLDASDTYFRDSTTPTGPSTLLRIPSDGSAPATPLSTETGAVFGLYETTNRVVYRVGSLAGFSIKTVPKVGGSATTLESAPVLTGGLVLVATKGTTVYYNIAPFNGPARAVHVNEDGTGKVETPQALWGFTTKLTTCADPFTLRCPDKILRVEGPGVSSTSVGGASVTSYVAGTTTPVATLGTLPPGATAFIVSYFGWGDKALASVSVNNGADVYFFDAATPNSLVKVNAGPPPPLVLAAAVLPGSRSVQAGQPATAFATIIAAGFGTATECTIAPSNAPPGTGFLYQQTDPHTNAPIGQPNTPATIQAGQAQSFVIAVTPTTPFDATTMQFAFACANTPAAGALEGVNTFMLASTSSPGPDIVALGATTTNDGIANIPGTTGTGFFSVATVNVGAGAVITATADTGSTILPVVLSLCQTNAVTGACINPVSPGSSAIVQIDANQTPTFAVFVQGTGNVPFLPGVNRAFVRFKTAGGATVGATSVAVRTQ